MFEFLPPLSLSIADCFGYLGTFLFLLSYQAQCARRTCLIQAPADLSYGVHFMLIGSPVGMLIALGGSVRDLVAARASCRMMKLFLGLFVFFAWTVALLMAQTPADFLAPVGTTLATLAMAFRDQFVKSRILYMGNQMVWLLFFLSVGSLPGILHNLMSMSSNLVGTSRYLYGRRPAYVKAPETVA